MTISKSSTNVNVVKGMLMSVPRLAQRTGFFDNKFCATPMLPIDSITNVTIVAFGMFAKRNETPKSNSIAGYVHA